MEENVYPNIKFTNDGWVVRVSKGGSLPGKFTNESAAKKALRSHIIKEKTVMETKRKKAVKKGS